MNTELNVNISPAMHEGFQRYFEHGVPMGSFGTALLENNLRGAVRAADAFNRPRIADYVDYLYWNAPCDCWGSPEKAADWIIAGGQVGWNVARNRIEDETGDPSTDAAGAARYWITLKKQPEAA